MHSYRIRIVAAAAAALLAGGAQAALHGRDLDGDAAAFEAWYDDALHVTWLADANLAASQGFGVPGIGVPFLGSAGGMDAATAAAWIAAMNAAGHGGFSDWRLPRALPLNGVAHDYTLQTDGGSDIGYRVGMPGTAFGGSPAHEMAHLFYVTLGNPAAAADAGFPAAPCPVSLTYCLVNPGPFRYGAVGAGESGVFWTGTPASGPAYAGHVHSFDMLTGYAGLLQAGTINGMAWAVRDGDVAAVPEPAAWALWTMALAGLAVRRRFLQSADGNPTR